MHVFFWILLLDWLIAGAWLLLVLQWRWNLRRIPDLIAQPAPHPAGGLPLLSVIVPARNEEGGIAATLRSLLASEGIPLEILAVDDRSTDQTGPIMDAIADAIGQEPSEAKLSVLHVTDLPAGWLGKTHAMELAAQQAKGEWLLFTDGDVVFDPHALRQSLCFAIESRADHMVLVPTVLLRTPGERMMIAFLQVAALWAVRLWRVPDPRAKLDSIGVGAFNLLRREAYDSFGGWQALRLQVVEDMALGRLVKKRGLAQRVALGRDLVSVRWATGAFGVVENLTKNLFAVFFFRPELLLAGAFFVALGTLFPLVMCFVALSSFGPMLLMLVALTIAYQKAGEYQHFSTFQLLLYPAASCLLIYALLRSMTLALWRGGIYWRGTFYPLKELRRKLKPT